MLNPYSNRKMITTAEDFYGRQKELQQIYSQLQTSQSISIVGSRRIGKSSLLYCLALPEIQEKLSVKEIFANTSFIYIDLLSKSYLKPSQFLSYILEKIYQNITGEIQSFPQNISFRHFEHHLEDLCSDKIDKIVLLMDEFDTITRNKQFEQEFFDNFRSLCNRFPVSLVTVSHRNLYELCHSEDVKSSPFFNIFQIIPLTLFPLSEAEQLIDYPSQKAGLEFNTRDKHWVLNFVGTHPFYIQLGCFFLFEKKQKEIDLDKEDFNEIEENVLRQAKGNFNHTLSKLNNDEITFLEKLVCGEDISEFTVSTHKNLENMGLICTENSQSRVFGRIFEKYLEEEVILDILERDQEKYEQSESEDEGVDDNKEGIEFIPKFTVSLRKGSKYEVYIIDPAIKIKTGDDQIITIITKTIDMVKYTGVHSSFGLNLSSHKIEYGKGDIVEGKILTRPINFQLCNTKALAEIKINPEEIEEIQIDKEKVNSKKNESSK